MKNKTERVSLSAFGQSLELDTGPLDFLPEDSIWRLREIYERFLAIQALPDEGVAIDIGAGFGAFIVPFGLANPGWKIIAFEPEGASYAALARNVDRHSLANVTVVNCAIGAPAAELPSGLRDAVQALDVAGILSRAHTTRFQRDRKRPVFVSFGQNDQKTRGAKAVEFDTLPVNALSGLNAGLLKFTCPGLESAVLEALTSPSLKYIVGESWVPPSTRSVFKQDRSSPSVYAPVAGTPLCLRREPKVQGAREGLDVVVAMYNSKDWIVECVDGIIRNDAEDVCAIVVDDGSTDGCGEIVAQHFGSNPRVKLVRKPNGGCASARNFGRLESNATQIAFVDADDVPDPELFPDLLELSRYSGSGVVQGAYDMLYDDPSGPRYEDSHEIADWAGLKRFPFVSGSYYSLAARFSITAQPTIWRRVYRRDFLDNKSVWFPEHIRAFDDQIFHMLSLYYAEEIFCIDHVKYHYRQHPAQDIRQGDERMFASLEMYRMTLKRAVVEGWPDYAPFVESYVNTVNWTHKTIRPDLKRRFLKGAAELWVYMRKVCGDAPFARFPDSAVDEPEFALLVAEFMSRITSAHMSYAWAYLDAPEMHPDMVRSTGASRH